MPTNDAGNAEERLNALWDRLVAGETAPTHPSDGADAAFIATLINQTPRLGEPARHRIRHRIFASTEGATTAMSAPGLSLPNRGDLIAPIPNSLRLPGRRRFSDQPLLRVAAMLLLAVSLVGGWAIFRDDGDGPLRGITYFPAGHLANNDSTPQADETTPQPQEITFLSETIEIDDEDSPAHLGLFHVVIEPGASWQAPGGRGGITWIRLGEVTIANEVTGETGELHMGESTTSEGNDAITVTNIGSDPAHVIHGVITISALDSDAPGVTAGVSVTRIGSAMAAPAGNRVATLVISPISGNGAFTEIVHDEVRVVSTISGVIRISLLAGSIEVHPGEVSLATPGIRDGINFVQLFPLDSFNTTSGASYRIESISGSDAMVVTFRLSGGDADASIQASPASVPVGEGALIPVTAVDCTIEPRSIDSFTEILANPMANGTPQTNLLLESPAGVPADAETIAGVTDTIIQVVACNSPPTLEMYSIYSENLLRIQAIYGMAIAEIESLERFSPPDNPDQVTGYVTIQNVQVLPDGRVTAMVSADGEIAFVTFVFENGRWLIDFWDDSFED